MDREVEVNQNAEMTEANINIHASHLTNKCGQPTLLKDNFILRDRPLTEIARVANQNTGFTLSLPARGFGNVFKKNLHTATPE